MEREVKDIIGDLKKFRDLLPAVEDGRLPPRIPPGPMLSKCEERFDSLLDEIEAKLGEVRT